MGRHRRSVRVSCSDGMDGCHLRELLWRNRGRILCGPRAIVRGALPFLGTGFGTGFDTATWSSELTRLAVLRRLVFGNVLAYSVVLHRGSSVLAARCQTRFVCCVFAGPRGSLFYCCRNSNVVWPACN